MKNGEPLCARYEVGGRGPKRGSIYVPWTDEEWAVVNDALDNGNPSTRAMDLEDKLPGRTRTNIHNALNIARRRRDSVGE